MTPSPSQTRLPVDPPKKRKRQSSHEPNSNKPWKDHDQKLIGILRIPGWNIHVVAHAFGRTAKSIYNRAVLHRDAGRITDLPPWSVLMAQPNPYLAPPCTPEPVPAEIVATVHTPGAMRPEPEPPAPDAFTAETPGTEGAVVRRANALARAGSRQAVSQTPEPVPCAHCGNPTSETVFIEDAGRRYHVDCHQQHVAEIRLPGADYRTLAVVADAFVGVVGAGVVGLNLLFEFDGGSRESLLLGLSFYDQVNDEIATERRAGDLLVSILGAVGVERVDAIAGRVVLVDRNSDGAILAFEAPSFVPHEGRFDFRVFSDVAVA